MANEEPSTGDVPTARSAVQSRRPKGRALTSSRMGPRESPAKRPPGWVTYIVLVAAVVTSIVNIVITYRSNKSNHAFERKQAALGQKYAAYPQLQGDLFNLEEALKNCEAAEDLLLQPGDEKLVGTTNQETWFTTRVVNPMVKASDKLSADGRSLSALISPEVHQLLQDMQTSQQVTKPLCIHYTSVLVDMSGSSEERLKADQANTKMALMKLLLQLENRDEQLDKQILAEIAER